MSENKIVLQGLHHLKLIGLSNLRAFCQGSLNFEFPSLREVLIRDCNNMEAFSYGSLHSPKLEKVTLEIGVYKYDYVEMGDLNDFAQLYKRLVCPTLTLFII